jgi:hypothetical protein
VVTIFFEITIINVTVLLRLLVWCHGERVFGLGFEHENMRFFSGLNGPCFGERCSS